MATKENEMRSAIRAKSSLFLVTLGALILTSIPAHAGRSIGAFSGSPLDGTPSSCFIESAGAVIGTGAAGCVGTPFSDSPRWEVALPIDQTAGSTWSVSVGMKGNGTNGPVCQAYAVNQLSGIVATSSAMSQVGASFAVVALTGNPPGTTPGIAVPLGGYLFVACGGLNTSFGVGAINWSTP